MVSKYEMHFYYHGVGDLQLMWRSDLETNPFPIPAPGTRFFKIPAKTVHGVFGTKLNEVWDDVAPQIIASMKVSGLQYSALTTARFSTVEDSTEPTLGPVVIWIAVRPNTAKPRDVCDATPDILQILAKFNITDVVVQWYEGSVVRLDGPPLMKVVKNSNAKFGLNTPFNTGLGIPIARQSDDAQGTLTLLFKEVQTSSGDPSNRVLALTNKHVASLDTTTDYELDEADPQHILVCGERRLDLAITEIEKAVAKGFRDAVRLFEEVKELEKALGTDEEDTQALDRKRNALKEKNEDHAGLKELFDEVKGEWKDSNGRRFGIVDWAPKIAVRVDERKYTRDIATFVADGEKLKNFVRNSIDLGAFRSASPPSIPASLTDIQLFQVTNTRLVSSKTTSGPSMPFARAERSQPVSSSPSAPFFLASASSIPTRWTRTAIPSTSSASTATRPSLPWAAIRVWRAISAPSSDLSPGRSSYTTTA
jgi:hypothetical protein